MSGQRPEVGDRSAVKTQLTSAGRLPAQTLIGPGPPRRTALGAVDISAMGDVYYRYHAGLVVDPVNHQVGATAGAEPVVHWREQSFADPVGIGKQRAFDELIRSRCNGFRQGLAQGAADS